jgi:hypothetical protein
MRVGRQSRGEHVHRLRELRLEIKDARHRRA